MKPKILLLIMMFVVNIVLAQTPADKEAVKKVILMFQDDFNDGAFKNARQYAANDWIHIHPGGGIKKGIDEVLAEVIAVHVTFLKGVTMKIDTMDIRFVHPDVAVADVVHTIDTYENPPGVMHVNEKQMKLYVVAKINGKWLMTHDQNTIIMDTNTAANK
ncbi:DUF4440 domain-containing protein [Flavihumibacter sp. ZG627]|uniref:YybH family protein n=1 Tax=Flavihumibacter sp. ZG627 TaxID=1463156 RepID=UPI00057E34C3|nr:DUF4440 domain-containing protein [Flavihumibacter sp. ZG627]KIC91281.1 hypothetical protein HY58_09820 [Flavihumibacter sp. ZG627]